MSTEKLRSVLQEADDLGISIALLAGGEPLTRPDLLEITAEFPRMIFPLFTNGTLINDKTVMNLRQQRNVVPVLSLEGHHIETNRRRGQGVYEHLRSAMLQLKDSGIFFGTSLTVTQDNFDLILNPSFVSELISAGTRLFFFVDYVPVESGTEALVLTQAQREQEAAILSDFRRRRLPALFVAFPGDEEMFGGCLAAGRGFVHISPEGRLEPCPFSPFSDASLQDMPLVEALQSKFLQSIRESEEHLGETSGGCALWENREWVSSLLQAHQQSSALSESNGETVHTL